MNIDKILKFFVPKDHSFHPLFEEDAINLVRAAELFKQMLSSTDSEYHEKNTQGDQKCGAYRG